MKEKITIGKLAAAANVNIETIRFYERKGVLKQPNKLGHFRYYPEEYITRIRFIKRSQELGFSLKETVDLLELKIKDQAKCSDVLTKAEEKISEIDKKIKDLKQMRKSLKDLANCCEDKSIPLSDCPVLECFINGKDK